MARQPCRYLVPRPHRNPLSGCAVALLTFWLLLPFAGCGREDGAKSHQTTIAPTLTELSLRAGRESQYDLFVRIGTDGVRSAPVDVLFVFDATESMTNVIAAVKRAAAEIAESLRTVSQNVAYGLASFGDYPVANDPSGSTEVWTLHSDIDRDAGRFARAVPAVMLKRGGHDLPEPYARALDESLRVGWRPDATKFVLLFGDAEYHDPDPGRDGIRGTADDLRMDRVLGEFRGRNIKVIALHERPPWLFGKSRLDEAIASLTTISDRTGGFAVELVSTNEVVAAIRDAIVRAYIPPRPAVRPQGEHAHWIAVGTPNDTDARKGAYEYPIGVSVPPEAQPGVYEIPLAVLAFDGTAAPELGRALVKVTVRESLFTVDLLLWILPIVLLPLVAILVVLLLRWGRAPATGMLYLDRGTLPRIMLRMLVLIGGIAALLYVLSRYLLGLR